ncbi:MAG: YbjN domain-containing protein [Acidimicrobiales bacterium]
MIDTVIAYLENEEWPYQRLEERSTVRVAYSGDHGSWNCYALAREEHEQLIFYSVYPEKVAPEQCAEVAQYLTRANYGLMIGNFEMDLDDGDVRYKTGLQIECELTPEMVRAVVLPNVVVMDRYLPGLRAVATSGLSARAALSLVEG